MKNVAIIGKNTSAVKCAEILVNNKNANIVLISPNNSDDGKDSWQLSLENFAVKNNLPIKSFKKIKSLDSIEYLKSLNLDFIFSIQYDQIINQSVIDTAKYGAINLHFSPLPRYRGVSPIALAMMNGENTYGVSLHYMDPGVDTGDIIAQKMFNISHLNNARELYDLSTQYSIELFKENIDSILTLENNRIPQDNTQALYHSMGTLNFKENKIKWNKDTRSLVNWIKSFIFPPFQYPKFILDETEYEVVFASPDYCKNNFEKPGTLILRDGNHFKFSTHDCYINVIVKEKE
ncbi:methionyl-tRNA formyltransferase [bacterium BMS3Abin04]|nr:methionyl-tRNA formyltransferase [bacterium BMS3Abin04]